MNDFLVCMALTVLTLVPMMMWLVMTAWVVTSVPIQSVVVQLVRRSMLCGPWVVPSGLEGRPVVLPLAAVLVPVSLSQDIGNVLVVDSSLGNVRRFRRLSMS